MQARTHGSRAQALDRHAVFPIKRPEPLLDGRTRLVGARRASHRQPPRPAVSAAPKTAGPVRPLITERLDGQLRKDFRLFKLFGECCDLMGRINREETPPLVPCLRNHG